MEAYETEDTLNYFKMKAFCSFLDEKIGTEYEVNESASGNPDEYYIVVFDLTNSEVKKLRDFEIALEGSFLELKESQTAKLREEYRQGVSEEVRSEYSYDTPKEKKEAEASVLDDILRAPSPNSILLNRFKGSNYVADVARELNYELGWMVVSEEDKSIKSSIGGDNLFSISSGDEYEQFMIGLKNYARDRLIELRGYGLHYNHNGSIGTATVYNENIVEDNIWQKLAELKGKLGITYYVSDLPEDVIKEIEDKNIELMKLEYGKDYICVSREDTNSPWKEIEIEEISNSEFKFINKKDENVLRHYLDGQKYEIGINGSPISGDFIETYRERMPYTVMMMPKRTDTEKKLKDLKETNTVNVVTVKSMWDVSVVSFEDTPSGNSQAEEEFIKRCKSLKSDLDMDEDSIEALKEDSYFSADGTSILITHSVDSLIKEELLQDKSVEDTIKKNSQKREANNDNNGGEIRPTM